MELLLIQSQEHDKLPIAELNAVIECENIPVSVNPICDGLVLLDFNEDNNFDKNYKKLVKRLAYTHEIDKIIFKSNIDNLNEDILKINWDLYIDDNFAVRVKRFNSDIDTVQYEKDIGSLILKSFSKNSNVKVKLEKPSSFIRVVAFESTFYIAIENHKLNKKHFQDMKPHKRPFFYPGSMSPKLARCMVNLSRIKEGQLLLDPFCGTGGILIEGGLVGAKLVGSDIKWKMQNGTATNLNHCNISDYKTFHVDVRELKMYEQVDAVVTDPPYGISTSTMGVSSDEIFFQFFESIYKNMKEDAYLCMASPHYLDLEPMMDKIGFELVERYEIKMHKSLTRIISVIKIKN
ncbi:TIGR01177 family methyltransferase [Methanobrevibacter sp. DSM 116169]|uniref:TIGR01177 family methyltransferase n=1 Tax=Methanobrevibacter sp. DSM 116169 TaxID=3242727 RepID=UPI0038FC7C4A